MTRDSHWKDIGEEALRFYGKISASISHEIKNVLAVLNENAGLLEDLTFMADKGNAIPTERLKSLAQSMKSQVQRADGIVGNMNRFAHSVDEVAADVDLVASVSLVVDVSQRFADMRSIALDFSCKEETILITTHPFFLENILWRCLEFMMAGARKGDTVRIVAERTEDGPQVRFSGVAAAADGQEVDFPSDSLTAMQAVLGAEISYRRNSGTVVLVLAEKII